VSAIRWMIRRFIFSFLDSVRKPLACGHLQLNAPDEAQVRFMAVDENARGRGYGSRILQGLEAEATRRGAQKLVLNARDNVTEFYAKHGYAVVGEAENAFRRDSPCADGEVVVIMILGILACLSNYVLIVNPLAFVLTRVARP
jgi:N-acetylglutamate synthase-like GNAT family acetyltransferase